MTASNAAAQNERPERVRARLFGAALAFVLLSGCGIDRLTSFGDSSASPVTEQASTAENPRIAPPVDLVGRWMLSSPGTDGCAMTFGAVAGATEGTIAPVGGCPYTFFTARKWTYEDRGLVIRDHTSQLLVVLAYVATDRFGGQTPAGHGIELSR
jgi:hypothetical protein